MLQLAQRSVRVVVLLAICCLCAIGAFSLSTIKWNMLRFRSVCSRFHSVNAAGTAASRQLGSHFRRLLLALDCGPRRRALVLGLDAAGKSALCQLLAVEQRQGWASLALRPEHHVLHYQLDVDGFELDLVDACSSDDIDSSLAQWDALLRSRLDGVVFVVDAADQARFGQARYALRWLLQQPAVQGKPVLVLGNKVDKRGAVGHFEFTRALGLAGITNRQRETLLGRAGASCLPLELRQRIADFQPDDADQLPHDGPLSVRMCSIERQWSVRNAVRWLVSQQPARAAARSSRLLSSSTRCVDVSFRRCIRRSDVVARQALLPLHMA